MSLFLIKPIHNCAESESHGEDIPLADGFGATKFHTHCRRIGVDSSLVGCRANHITIQNGKVPLYWLIIDSIVFWGTRERFVIILTIIFGGVYHLIFKIKNTAVVKQLLVVTVAQFISVGVAVKIHSECLSIKTGFGKSKRHSLVEFGEFKAGILFHEIGRVFHFKENRLLWRS